MATTNEQLKSMIGIVDPKDNPDNKTLRAIAGVPSFADENVPPSEQIQRPKMNLSMGLRM